MNRVGVEDFHKVWKVVEFSFLQQTIFFVEVFRQDKLEVPEIVEDVPEDEDKRLR